MAITIDGTTGIAGVDGSASTPAYQGADTNTGIAFPAADTVSVATGGTERMRVDSSGNVGIGTSSPTDTQGFGKALDVQGSTGAAVYVGASGDRATLGYASGELQIRNPSASGTTRFYVNSTERIRIDSDGNLLVGTTTTSVATEQGIVLKPTEGFLLNNSTTLPGQSLILLYSSYSTADQTKFEVTSEGNVKSRTNSYAGFSDERLKQGITSSGSQWEDIKNIEVVKFQMKSEQLSDEENPWMLGVVAQQVENISPGLVEDDSKDGMKTVKYSVLYMKAVKALQEAMERIETLEAKVTALEASNV